MIQCLPLVAALTSMIPAIATLFKKGDNSATLEAVSHIAQKVTNTKNPEEILRLLEGNLEMRLRFDQELLKYEEEMVRLEIQDKDSARKRDIALLQAGKHNHRADIMVVCAALGLAGCLGSLAWFQSSLPGEVVGIISTIAGIFGSCLKDAYTFEFGSSRGSKNKDEHVAAFLRK